jgi:hypothetical protein
MEWSRCATASAKEAAIHQRLLMAVKHRSPDRSG